MTKNKILKTLLEEKIIQINLDKEITFASGIKSIIYCDNRKILGNLDLRNDIVNYFIENIDASKYDVIAGTATAGIPWSAFIAQSLNKKMSYVRLKAKDHGTSSLVEGSNVKKQRILLIEDLITTGSSVLKAAEILKNEKCKSVDVMSIFTYNFKIADLNFKKSKIKYNSILNFNDLSNIVKNENEDLYLKLMSWWNSVK